MIDLTLFTLAIVQGIVAMIGTLLLFVMRASKEFRATEDVCTPFARAMFAFVVAAIFQIGGVIYSGSFFEIARGISTLVALVLLVIAAIKIYYTFGIKKRLVL